MSLIKSYAAKLPPAVIRQIIVRKIYTCLCVECFIVSPLCKGCEIIYNNLWHIYTRPSLKFLSQTCTWFYLFRRLGYKLQADNHTHHGQYTLFITVEPNAFNRFNISFTNHCNITKICWKQNNKQIFYAKLPRMFSFCVFFYFFFAEAQTLCLGLFFSILLYSFQMKNFFQVALCSIIVRHYNVDQFGTNYHHYYNFFYFNNVTTIFFYCYFSVILNAYWILLFIVLSTIFFN